MEKEFHYNYSAKVNQEVEEIRSRYVGKPTTGLDELKALDAKVKRPAKVFAYLFGSIAAIIMGSGMSLVMTEIGATLGISHSMAVGIAVGCVGLLMALINYPIYKAILKSRRIQFMDQILALSERVMNEEKN